MKSLGKNCFRLWALGLLFLAFSTSAQAQKLWSEVRLNKQSVYLGEPVEVTVSVYTSTWFTAGVDPGNIKVNGAYTVFFRNVSTSKTVNGKTMSGVEMIFNVFPNTNENITFPALEIEVETPKEGDYKGIYRKIKTKPRAIKVRPIPPGFSAEEWLVTSSLSVNERWSGDVKNVKVGDVLTRTITRNAASTVSQLVPPVAWDSVPGVSQYPYRSHVESKRSKTAISATRTETMRYLFEKEGEVIIPEMEFTWWNAYHKRLYKRTLKEVKINVQPNPDLGMLASVRDSLNAQIAATEAAEEEADAPLTILGMSVKKFASVLAALILLLIAFVLLLKWGINYRKNYLHKYHNSELFYWRNFVRAASGDNHKKTTAELYLWIDQLGLHEPTATCFAKIVGDAAFISEIKSWEKDLGQEKNQPNVVLAHWRKARKMYISKSNKTAASTSWINP